MAEAAPQSTSADRATISVVMPVLNEERRIGRQLEQLLRVTGVAEVVVVDGGSEDATAELARRHAQVVVIDAPRGRASQMNRGAAVATGEILLFLHADVELPDDAARTVRATLGKDGVVAGAFRTRTVPEPGVRSIGPLLRLADVRSRLSALPYGDQALFLRRSMFVRAGGFPPLPILEDLELAKRLRALGRIDVLDQAVRVSGRRFQANPIRAMMLMRAVPWLHRLGVSPERLASWYLDDRRRSRPRPR